MQLPQASSPGQAGQPDSAPPLWIERAFTLAAECQLNDMPEQAKDLYLRILEQQPNHALALHNLGMIAGAAGDMEARLALFERAAELDPGRPALRSSLGSALRAAGDLERARAEYRMALQLDPDCVEALYNFGNLLNDSEFLGEAIECFEKVLALRPAHTDARNNLGNLYKARGRFKEAAQCLERVIQDHPDDFRAYANLAGIVRELGDAPRAEVLLRRAIELAPDHAYLRSNLGDLLFRTNRLGAAVESYEDAIRLAPEVAEFHLALGCCYGAQGRHPESLAAQHRGLAMEPTFATGHQIPLFMLHHSPDLTPKALAEEHRKWDLRHAACLSDPGRRHANSPEPGRRLRVGYVSADFHAHPVGYFTAPVFAAHNPEQVEIVCYGLDRDDPWALRIRRHASLWRNMKGLGDAELAEMIERDRIDILVDLAGHTAGNRLLAFARRPAPVQVSWLGYFDTTGMEAMDYLLVDPHLAPLEEEAPFVEKPLRLPGCYLAYEIPNYAPAPAPAPCGYRGFVTYGSFNSISKVGLEVVSVWAEILRRNPTAHMAMMNEGLGDGPSRDLYRRYFEDCGITPDRLHLSARADHLDVFGTYAHLDLALDPFPYNGGTTTCEALAMGVPVLTLRGDRFVSRVGSTILQNAGLPDLIAHSREEYIEKAVELGRNPDRLVRLRSGMRVRLAQSTLCDITGFTRKLENAYREIWSEWCSGQPRD